MKLVKLSLAAVVAAGSFSFANAVALDEAIQNVDLSGMLRYRYDTKLVKDYEGNKENSQAHKYRANFKFSADIADNFKAIAYMRYDSGKDFSYGDNQNANAEGTFKVRETYLTYENFNTKFSFGKMKVNSFWTDGVVGNGITVANNSIEGLTLLAYMFDNYNHKESDLFDQDNYETEMTDALVESVDDMTADEITTEVNEIKKKVTEEAAKIKNPTKKTAFENLYKAYDETQNQYNDITDDAEYLKNAYGVNSDAYFDKNDIMKALYHHNIYGVAALVDYEPVSAGLWVSYVSKLGTFYAVDLGFEGGDDSFGYSAHAQYAGNSLKGKFKNTFGFANGNFFGVEAGLSAAGFSANIGYVNFGKKDKWTIHSLHDKGQLMNIGEIAMDGYNGGFGKRDYIFGTLGYKYDAVEFSVDIVSGKVKVFDEKVKLFEVTPRLSYKYSDKLKFSAFYAYGETKHDEGKDTEKQIRLEAKYTF